MKARYKISAKSFPIACPACSFSAADEDTAFDEVCRHITEVHKLNIADRYEKADDFIPGLQYWMADFE